MKTYNGTGNPHLKLKARAIAIGIFDGVHRGHEIILNKAIREAKHLKINSMVITFEPHPQKILFPQKKSPQILMSLEHRLRLFAMLGISETLVIPFNKKFANVSHENFLKQILIKKLGMKVLSVGNDFCFGKFARGNHVYLKEQSVKQKFKLFLTNPIKFQGRAISSTRVRESIEKGDLPQASKMLGRPVSLYGTVIHGRGRGKSVGFPTANLNPHHETLPPAGVYAASGFLGKMKLNAVVHVGQRPTFADKEKSVEVHFIGFKGNLYGEEIELLFLTKLRGIQRFSSPKQLALQITKDIKSAKKWFDRPVFNKYNH